MAALRCCKSPVRLQQSRFYHREKRTGSTYVILVIVLIVGKFNHPVGALQRRTDGCSLRTVFISIDYSNHSNNVLKIL